MGDVPWIRKIGPERRDYDKTEDPRSWMRDCVEVLDDPDAPGSPLSAARSSFTDWLLSKCVMSGDRSDGKRLIRALGYRTGRVAGVTVLRGLRIHYLGQRGPSGDPGGTMEVLSALGALTRAGMVSREESRRAWEEYDG